QTSKGTLLAPHRCILPARRRQERTPTQGLFPFSAALRLQEPLGPDRGLAAHPGGGAALAVRPVDDVPGGEHALPAGRGPRSPPPRQPLPTKKEPRPGRPRPHAVPEPPPHPLEPDHHRRGPGRDDGGAYPPLLVAGPDAERPRGQVDPRGLLVQQLRVEAPGLL